MLILHLRRDLNRWLNPREQEKMTTSGISQPGVLGEYLRWIQDSLAMATAMPVMSTFWMLVSSPATHDSKDILRERSMSTKNKAEQRRRDVPVPSLYGGE